jgi:hypothetical protein
MTDASEASGNCDSSARFTSAPASMVVSLECAAGMLPSSSPIQASPRAVARNISV